MAAAGTSPHPAEIRLVPCASPLRRLCYIENLSMENFEMVSRRGMKWLACRAAPHRAGFLTAFSTRAGGASRAPAAGLNLGFTPGEARSRVRKNREAFLGALGAARFKLAEVHQIHSTLVYRVRKTGRGKLEFLPCGYPLPSETRNPLPQGDALITNEAGILLAVKSADCVPILLMDPERRAVAAIHAGWKGMLGGIAEKTVGEMRRLFDARPRAMLATIGPSIRACCYEVSEDLAATFSGAFTDGDRFIRKAPKDKFRRDAYPPPFLSLTPPGHGTDGAPRSCLDLVAAAQYQLLRAGLKPSQIHVADFCTACRTDLFFSHRKEGSRTGRMMAVIGIRPRANQTKS